MGRCSASEPGSNLKECHQQMSRRPEGNHPLHLLILFVIAFGLPGVMMATGAGTALAQYAQTAWRVEDGVVKARPQAIAQTNDGDMWIPSKACDLRFDGLRFVALDDVVQTPPGLNCNTSGILWAGGKCGPTRIHKNEVGQWWSRLPWEFQQRLIYDVSDGFWAAPEDFSPLHSRTRDRRQWFAPENGMQMVELNNLRTSVLPPPVMIEAVVADHVRLAHLHLHHLAPFHVKACNESRVWNDQDSSLHLMVEPSWHQAMCSRLLAGTIILTLLLTAYLIRARVLSERMQLRAEGRMAERLRTSRELHDTLLQGLQGMILRFSNLTTRVSPEVEQEMNRSLDDAETLLIASRERIKEMLGAASEGSTVASELQGFATSLFAKDGCKVAVETHGHHAPLAPIVHEEILWIAREALANSCRHSEGSHIIVKVIYTPKSFRLSVEDDGIGLPVSLTRNRGHFGLVTMHERAEAIGGRFSVRSETGNGTKVCLHLSSRLAYAARGWWLSDFISRRLRRIRL
jgi:signal transduction histidine kinase